MGAGSQIFGQRCAVIEHAAQVAIEEIARLIDAVQADNYVDVEGDLTFDGAVTRAELRW